MAEFQLWNGTKKSVVLFRLMVYDNIKAKLFSYLYGFKSDSVILLFCDDQKILAFTPSYLNKEQEFLKRLLIYNLFGGCIYVI